MHKSVFVPLLKHPDGQVVNAPDHDILGSNSTLGRIQLMFVCVEVLRPSQPNGVMLSMVSLPNHTFTGQA